MSTLLSSIFAAAAASYRLTVQPDRAALPSPTGIVRSEATVKAEPLAKLSLTGHLLLPVAIFAVSFFSIEFSHASNFVGTLWPSNAIVLTALLRHRRSTVNFTSILFGGAVAMALAGFAAGNPLRLNAILAFANATEISIAVVLLSAFGIGASNLTSFRNLIIFMLVGGVAPFGSVVVGALVFSSAHGIPWPLVWRNWYAGHSLGMIILAPFLLSVTSGEWQALRDAKRLPELAALFVVFVFIGAAGAYFRPFVFVVAPAILFATVRFGLIGATAVTFLSALIVSVFVVLGIGQPLLPQSELSERILNMQMFLAITSFWSLPTAALVTERDRLLRDLSRANAQLTAESERKSHLVTGLRHHLTTTEEKVRLRLSHELHDQAGQSLIAAILELNEIDPLTAGLARDRLHLVRKKMEDLGKTLHRIAWELRPASIDELGLRKALASYIADWGEQCGTDVDFHCGDAELDQVPSEIGTAIYRIVQEALTNIVKHAQRPSNVSVVIRRADAILQVIVEDNGCGFDPATPAAKSNGYRGLGLYGMRERLALIGGTLEIESAATVGTTVFARIALDSEGTAA
jgi:signal transduction histidine kinase